MLKNPEDRRARRTRRLLKESLLELMEQKHFSEISVRDVTDNADMNRTTFYLHYTDTTQLLQSMEEDLLAEAQVLVDAHIPGNGGGRHPAPRVRANPGLCGGASGGLHYPV